MMRKKITFYCDSMDSGGTEKATLDLVNNLSKEKYEITVVQLAPGGKYHKQLHRNIKCKEIIHVSPKKAFRLYWWARKIYNKIPIAINHKLFIGDKQDVEIACGYGYPTQIVAKSKKAKKISWIHMDVSLDRNYVSNLSREEGEEYLLKPMNCPHHCEIYKVTPRSYKDLPLRFAEFGTVYRYEQSGELHGLTRVRSFTQDDAHIFMLPEQIKDEIKDVVRLIDSVYKVFGFQYGIELSTRPEDSMGTDEEWEIAENGLREALEELADSIRQFGIIQPIVVQKKDDYYEIIAGERRWRAAKLAKLKEVPVIIKEYTPQEVMEIALIENIQRKDLNPIEEALAYKSLINEYSLKQDELAKRVSKSRAAIANSMRLLRLADKVQAMLIDEQISMGHARALLSLELEDLQIEAANTIIEKGLSVRDTEKLVKSILNPKQAKLPIPTSEEAVYTKLSDKLKEIMGTKVSINHKKGGKGKIEIEYYSQEELERILELFDGIQN